VTSTNTQFALAVHVLTLLSARSESLQSSASMSESTGSNPAHLRRVLGRLRAAGLVSSRPGPRGGWRLRRDPAEVTLADLWRVVNDEDPVLGLHEASPHCMVGQRIHTDLEQLDERVREAIEAELGETTLAGFSASHLVGS
jgi:Rrf2 family protein